MSEHLELLASDLDDTWEILGCVVGRLRSAHGSTLWEGRSTESMYVGTISRTKRWFRPREAALRLLIVICRPLAPGIISEGWRAHDRPHVVVIVRLTRLRLIDPIETVINIVIALRHKDVAAVANLGVVVEAKGRVPILPITGPPMLRRSHLNRQRHQMFTPHSSDLNVKILIRRGMCKMAVSKTGGIPSFTFG